MMDHSAEHNEAEISIERHAFFDISATPDSDNTILNSALLLQYYFME